MCIIEKNYKMLDKFYSFVIDEIGFSLTEEVDEIIWLEYDNYKIPIYNPIESKFEPRYSLVYGGETIVYNGARNFALDDLELLKNSFKDVIRENKLKLLGI